MVKKTKSIEAKNPTFYILSDSSHIWAVNCAQNKQKSSTHCMDSPPLYPYPQFDIYPHLPKWLQLGPDYLTKYHPI